MRDLFHALLMGLYEPRVQLGIAQGIAYHDAHGVIHSADDAGITTQHAFVVDAPKYLRTPSQDILRQVLHQAQDLGLQPQHIEVFVGERRLYNGAGQLLYRQ